MSLSGRVCVVTGASRGIGKGIALQLGQEGATVYVTGRTLKSTPGSLGSLEQTVNEIDRRGGKGIAVQCDQTKDEDIEALFGRVKEEQNGRLDLLVNNAFSGDMLLDKEVLDKDFYEMPHTMWDSCNDAGLRGHYVCTVHASRLMAEQGSGLIVYISSPVGMNYMVNVTVGVGKCALDRMAADCGHELAKKNVSCVSLYPGWVKTEKLTKMVESGEMSSITIDGTTIDLAAGLETAETPEFQGLVVVTLMKENLKQRMKRNGRVHVVADIADEYGIKDINGKRPLSFRSFAGMLTTLGYTRLAWFLPRWLKMPKWVLALGASRF